MSSYIILKDEQKVYVTCRKCHDRFILDFGGKSMRRPCRRHSYNSQGICQDCGRTMEGRGGNCYHIRKNELFDCCNIS